MIGVIKVEKVWHKHILRVQYNETDQMGVVHHGNYVNWFEIGRTEMMRAAKIAYRDIEKKGLILPVLDMNIKYRKSAYYDECVAVYTCVSHYSAVRLQFDYEVRRHTAEKSSEHKSSSDVSQPTGELIATGSTLHMWLNDQWKPARIDKIAPETFKLIQEVTH